MLKVIGKYLSSTAASKPLRCTRSLRDLGTWPGPAPSSPLTLFHPDRGRSTLGAPVCVCFLGGGISLLKNRSPGPTDPSYKWTRVKLISATKSQPIPRGLLYTLRSDRSTMEVDEHRTSTVPHIQQHTAHGPHTRLRTAERARVGGGGVRARLRASEGVVADAAMDADPNDDEVL